MRPLRFSINTTLDGCCDHAGTTPDEELHRHHAGNLAQALTEPGLIDEYELVHPRLAGRGPTLFDGLSKPVDLRLRERLELGLGAMVWRYVRA